MKTLLFDADGVLTLPGEFFMQMYARSHGLDPEPFEKFFKNNWEKIVTGKKDLKESISENSELWQWSGPVDDLVAEWCKTEDVRNDEMLGLIKKLNQFGYKCHLATDQESYRGAYMKEVMFANLFDKYFISSDLGVTKTDKLFFEKVINELGVLPSDIVFFDDSQSKVDTAKGCGIDARLFTSVDQVKQLLP